MLRAAQTASQRQFPFALARPLHTGSGTLGRPAGTIARSTAVLLFLPAGPRGEQAATPYCGSRRPTPR